MTLKQMPVEAPAAQARPLLPLQTPATDGASGADIAPAHHQDAIVLSDRAKFLMRAGRAVRALVFSALSTVYRSVEIKAGLRVLVEGGIYRCSYRA